jgi:hypothetical protein
MSIPSKLTHLNFLICARLFLIALWSLALTAIVT